MLPEVDASNPSRLVLDETDFSIEIHIGDDDPLEGFAFHVRGGYRAVLVVSEILAELDLRALDPQSETGFFEPGPQAQESFRRWRGYRNQVVGDEQDND